MGACIVGLNRRGCEIWPDKSAHPGHPIRQPWIPGAHYLAPSHQFYESKQAEAPTDAITILSKFNVTNLRQLLLTFKSEKVMMSEVVFCMIKIAQKSDYFYLSHLPESELQQTLAHFFQNYLPLSISTNSILLRTSVLIAAFYCCWHVS